MDNLAHTLVGISLAKAGFERTTPLATTALVISSNLPDIDVLMRIPRGTLGYIEYHRGHTHSFVGLAVLGAALTLVLVYLDRRFRLRTDPFRRPVRPWRLFWICYLGGLGHMFMDFTNAYGVRPLLPFSNRWFYGDLAFVVDPYIWLILGSVAVWLTTKSGARAFLWCVVGVLTSLPVVLALRNPAPGLPGIPQAARIGWFVGIAMIFVGSLLNVRAAGERLARYALLVLAFYYGGMWFARAAAIQQVRSSPIAPPGASIAAWPAPANPLRWQGVASEPNGLYVGWIDLVNSEPDLKKLNKLEPDLLVALQGSREARSFLEFARYWSTTVDTRDDGYEIELRDLRFDLRLRATLDSDLRVRSAEVRWF